MNRNYYNEYYELERNHWWFRAREKILMSQLQKHAPKKSSLNILNVGAATGRSSEALAEFGDVTSIEYDKICCDYVNNKTDLNLIQGSITDLPFPSDQFDIVCAFDVIEHVKDHELATKELSRVCNNGGMLMITVPAYMFLWSHHDEVNHHYRRYSKKNLRLLFNKLSLKESQLTYFNSILFLPILIFRSLSKLIPRGWIIKGSGSDFSSKWENSIVDSILFQIFNLEKKLMNYISFPFGVSLLGIWKK